MQTKKILVVDDESKIRTLLRRCLESDGFDVVEAADESGLTEALGAEAVQLITLDVQLGGENGLEIVKRLRQHSNVPIIMVTGRDDVIDRIVGLEVGADDYISKPFHVREVIARVRTVLRRFESKEPTAPAAPESVDTGMIIDGAIVFDGLTAHLDRFELFDRAHELIEITSGDFRLLAIFLENPKRILSRDRIMDLMHGTDWSPVDRTIDNQVARLRKKIERNAGSPALLKTVRGIGYIFATEVTRSD